MSVLKIWPIFEQWLVLEKVRSFVFKEQFSHLCVKAQLNFVINITLRQKWQHAQRSRYGMDLIYLKKVSGIEKIEHVDIMFITHTYIELSYSENRLYTMFRDGIIKTFGIYHKSGSH